MAETAPVDHDPAPGFLARNNELIGSVLSIVALAISIALGAGLMFGTGTRGVAAILTVLLIAGSTFTLLLLGLAAVLRTFTPTDWWEREEAAWRDSMALPDPTPESEAKSRRARRLVVLCAIAAFVLGLSISVLPASL
ncbi:MULTISPECIES: hypothetical protein [Nocardioides]|uniref:Uncharacterized protein n=1 Tax=Nocardioides vastitatis TaxID=2568655 RepID=A0ABW0ZDG1_9ACTN|nr:hypothetical protein [Nocardioides sp.]THI93006.1 hypothetical protein E7Z54_21295 [Nocardioides sp.]